MKVSKDCHTSGFLCENMFVMHVCVTTVSNKICKQNFILLISTYLDVKRIYSNKIIILHVSLNNSIHMYWNISKN